MLNKETK